MGFWQGLDQGLTYVMEDKARKKELEDARQERAAERQSNIDLEEARYNRSKEDAEAQYKRQRTDAWADNLTKLQVEKVIRDREASAMSATASKFISRLGDSDPELSAALAKNPAVAAALEEQAAEAEKTAKKAGLSFPYQGEVLAGMIDWSPTGTATLAPPPPVNFAPQTQEEYISSLATLVTPTQPTINAALSADIFFIPDPANLKEGEALVDTKILDLANQKFLSMDSSMEGYVDLQKSIEEYPTANSAGRIMLQKEFGLPAYQAVVGMDNVYTQGIDKSPRFSDFADITFAQSVILSPDTTPEQKELAAKKLREVYGVEPPVAPAG